MREILFRGQRIDNGKWVEGVYYNQKFYYGQSCNKHLIIVSDESLDNDYQLSYYEVIPETVGQYTGLTDKNGKKIFEGDVVARYWLGSLKKYIIVYEEKDAMFIGDCINASGFTTFDRDGYEFELIGNIHDNPELLKGENNV